MVCSPTRLTLPPLVLGLLLTFHAPLAGQIDYRNLDDDRPLITEDAYPVERQAFEFLLPYAFLAEAGGERLLPARGQPPSSVIVQVFYAKAEPVIS
jgi:hypothetical protein